MSSSIYFLGGCHVNGIGVGVGLGFPSCTREVLRSSGMETDVEVFAHVRFRDTKKASDILSKERPDILVLQLGNYEASWAPFVTSLRRKRAVRMLFRSTGTSVSSSSSSSSSGPASAQSHEAYCQTAPNLVRQTVKWLADQAFARMIVDYERVHAEVNSFLDVILERRRGKVIVLTPFPHMDPANRAHRRRVGALVLEESLRRQLTVIDTFPLIGRSDSFLRDGAHLNAHGHKRLATALARAILQPEQA